MSELIHITCEPEMLTFHAPYDHRQTTIVTIRNDGKKRVAIKIRTTDNVLFKVNMVYGFIDAGSTKELHVRCQPFQFDPSKPINHRVVVVYTEAGDTQSTPQQLWKTAVEVKEVMMKVRFTVPAEAVVAPPVVPPIDAPQSAAPSTGVAADLPRTPSGEQGAALPAISGQSPAAEPVQGIVAPASVQPEERNVTPAAAAPPAKEGRASDGNIPPPSNAAPQGAPAPEGGEPAQPVQ